MLREPTGSAPLFPLRWLRDGQVHSQTRGDWYRSATEHPRRAWVLQGRTDDVEERGHRRSAPSRAPQMFREVKVVAAASSSWPPLRRRRDGPPGLVAAPSPAISINQVPA